MVGAHARQVFRDFNQIAKNELPSLTVLFKNPASKNVGLNIRVTKVIILMVPKPISANIIMAQNETVYMNTYMIYIYICMYIYIYIYLYNIYKYICKQGFHQWGIGGNPPTSQKFVQSPRTWNNYFFPHQRLVPSLQNKIFM